MSQSRQKGFYYYVSHDYLGVIDSYKGKGVASLLFQTFLEICRKEKYDFIVSDTNPKSFYYGIVFNLSNFLGSLQYRIFSNTFYISVSVVWAV